LQIINHLQDCGADYKNLNRVYVPLDALAAHGAAVEALGEVRATPELRAGLLTVVTRTAAVFERSRGLPASVADTRLALEISVIRTLAARLLGLLAVRDPLSEPVHLNKAAGIAAAAGGVTGGLLRRLWRPRPRAQRYQTQ
jgi:phytoene/squalene synthetase